MNILQALENLAPQLGLEAGLAGWEALSKQYSVGSEQWSVFSGQLRNTKYVVRKTT